MIFMLNKLLNFLQKLRAKGKRHYKEEIRERVGVKHK
jgi:hypothetical protein